MNNLLPHQAKLYEQALMYMQGQENMYSGLRTRTAVLEHVLLYMYIYRFLISDSTLARLLTSSVLYGRHVGLQFQGNIAFPL